MGGERKGGGVKGERNDRGGEGRGGKKRKGRESVRKSREGEEYMVRGREDRTGNGVIVKEAKRRYRMEWWRELRDGREGKKVYCED